MQRNTLAEAGSLAALGMARPAADPFAALNVHNRNEVCARLRQTTPVYPSDYHAAWVLTRYDDVSAVLRHKEVLPLDAVPFLRSIQNRGGPRLGSFIHFCESMSLLTRPPRHGAVRALLAQALLGVRAMDLPARLERHADALLAAGAQRGEIDLAQGYGRALAGFMVGNFLGIPAEDMAELSALGVGLLAAWEKTLLPVRVLSQIEQCAGALIRYFTCLLETRRRAPGEDGISLIARLAEQQLDCTLDELAQHCVFFFITSQETTAAGMSAAAHTLLTNPGFRAALTANPALLPEAARECLRLSTPLYYVGRQMAVDIELSSVTIRAGEPIQLMLGAANRDPEMYRRPDEPELGRDSAEPLVFGAGPYRCIGAQLANFEVELALRKLLAWPGLECAGAPAEWSDRMNIAPLRRLPAVYH